MDEPHPETLAVHAGRLDAPQNQPSSPPLFQASSYEFANLAEVEEIYGGRRPGRIYGRYGAPNAAQFESAMAALEGADAALGAASGMAAIDAALASSLHQGEAIVASAELYGGTYELLENDYRKGVNPVHFVDQHDLAAVGRALEEHRPKVLYLEALTNPLMHVADLPALSEAGRKAGATVIVDATFATPILSRPLASGVDLVVHSVGKYLGGHGDVGAGVLAGRGALVTAARQYLVRKGATMPHFEAWLALRGMRTLALRVERHTSNALAVADFLSRQPAVARVHHPSRPDHPQHDVAQRLYPRGTGGIVAFDLRDGADAVDPFLRGLRTIAIVHSLGEVATTISYPAVSSHRFVPVETRHALGVGDGTLRISTGIEHPDDIVADLAAAFAGLGERVRA